MVTVQLMTVLVSPQEHGRLHFPSSLKMGVATGLALAHLVWAGDRSHRRERPAWVSGEHSPA